MGRTAVLVWSVALPGCDIQLNLSILIGGYRTFKFSFQVRIRHRYVKIIDWSTALYDYSYNLV
eukprot:SAG31_NODE_639_length_13309_cov_4.008468_8_plen_63_part_00